MEPEDQCVALPVEVAEVPFRDAEVDVRLRRLRGEERHRLRLTAAADLGSRELRRLGREVAPEPLRLARLSHGSSRSAQRLCRRTSAAVHSTVTIARRMPWGNSTASARMGGDARTEANWRAA